MNVLDKVVGWVSPTAGLRRAQARAAIDMVRAYEAARPRRSNDGWVGSGTGPNSEVGQSLQVLRNRARQQQRDNTFGKRIVDVWTAHLVGDGIVSQAASDDQKVNQAVQEAWGDWAEKTACDADGRTNLYGLQRLACETMVASGDSLIRLRWRSPADYPDLPVPLQLEVLEGDYLDHTKNAPATDGGGFIIQGVEFDRRWKRVAYWLFTEHPGEHYAGRRLLNSIRVPAEEVIHLFHANRPKQVRGVPWTHASMTKVQDLDDYFDALQMKAKIEACFGAFVKRNAPETVGTLAGKTSSGTRLETFEPGMIHYLDDDEDVEFANPSNSSSHTLLAQTLQRAIAVGAGITYDQLTGDLSGANYSSLRAGKIEHRRMVSQIQWLTVIPVFCDPVWQAFIAAGAMMRKWKQGPVRVEHTPPAHEMIDPAKDIGAVVDGIRAGLITLAQGIRSMGYDPRRQLDEIAEINGLIDKLGIVLDSDPRKTSAAGLTQARAPGTELPPTAVKGDEA